MSASILLACLWLVIANVIGMFPSKRKHWPAAYILMPIGLLIVGFVTFQHGALVGVGVLIIGGWIVRWPVIYFTRWLMRLTGLSPSR